MDIYEYFKVVSAVIFANGFSVAFFLAAMKAINMQKKGAKDDELPLAVYFCLAVPLIVAAVGMGFVD